MSWLLGGKDPGIAHDIRNRAARTTASGPDTRDSTWPGCSLSPVSASMCVCAEGFSWGERSCLIKKQEFLYPLVNIAPQGRPLIGSDWVTCPHCSTGETWIGKLAGTVHDNFPPRLEWFSRAQSGMISVHILWADRGGVSLHNFPQFYSEKIRRKWKLYE